jgi:restriction system protein
MAIPDFQSIFLPLLKYAASRGGEVTTADAYDAMVKHFRVSPRDQAVLMPSRQGKTFRNRVAWAKQYLTFATLVVSVRHGVFRVTDLGRKWAKGHAQGLKLADFKTIPGFEERVHGREVAGVPLESGTASAESPAPATPDERIEAADAELRHQIIGALLERIVAKPPEFFEQLVIRLMSKLGYGDGTPESMTHTGGSNDEGIDGRIKRDVLGLDHILLQAKRYQPSRKVSRGEVAAFAGSAPGTHGVFLTTATFTPQALDFMRKNHRHIVLIDGPKLGELMLRCGLGVNEKRAYRVYSIDEDFFTDDE